jgi:hypothetical protein
MICLYKTADLRRGDGMGTICVILPKNEKMGEHECTVCTIIMYFLMRLRQIRKGSLHTNCSNNIHVYNMCRLSPSVQIIFAFKPGTISDRRIARVLKHPSVIKSIISSFYT